MQPLQYDLRDPAAKDNSITNAATARSNLDAAITMRSAETESQNTIELRATASEIVAPKPDLDARAKKKTILKHFLKGFLEGKSLAPKWRKSAGKSLSQPSCSHSNTIYEIQLQKTIVLRMQPQHEATLTQPLQCDLQRLSCKNTIELRATASEIVAPKPEDLDARAKKKTILKHFLKGFLEGKSLAPKWRKSADKSLSQPSCSHFNTIYEVQLQKTIVLRMQPKQEATLTQPLQMRSAKTELQTAIPFTLRERSYSCKAEWNSIGNSSTSNTCNPIYIAGTILQLQITMEFHRQLIHQHHLQSHLHCGNDPTVANHNGILSTAHARRTGETRFTMRNRSDHDPPMIRPHTRPSRNRRTAEVDHRGSGTDFVWKNIGFRASAISQKRISCETSFKTPSATPPPAPLAMPFALRERSYSCKAQWNSIGNSSTSTTCNPIYIAGTILQLQITMEFCRPHMHETQVKPHLQCGTDPPMIRT